MTAPTPVHDLRLAPNLGELGVHLTPSGGILRVFSRHATAVDLQLFGLSDPNWVTATVPMRRDEHGVFSAESPLLKQGARYGLRVSGPDSPSNMFDPARLVTDPYSRGIVRVGADQWRSQVVDESFNWCGATKPATPMADAVIYETHVKGLTKLNPNLPSALRGTYAGLAHPETIGYLSNLGVTAVELLPIHAFVSEQHLVKQGLHNYWGYNSLDFFAPHARYATKAAQAAGPDAVLAEFKGMVKLLHEAGLEVILDVVYNHTAEAGKDGPRVSFRGLDNASYYRQDVAGSYLDVTGCGNTMDFSKEAPMQLVLDSLRYWANEVQIDGFRFDLAATLGRDAHGNFDPRHPLLERIVTDPALAGVKMIAEPWDIGNGGWQTGNFAPGYTEWNDRYRNGVRDFWLSDIAYARHTGSAPEGNGSFATYLAGSAEMFHDRGPLASVNFVTAHDGFTLADLTAYDVKHNVGNGEDNRDGSEHNRSFNHGTEGATSDVTICDVRRKAMRNLLGTLLLSAGVPMLTGGDETGRSQHGNNNPYCHDSELTWLNWDLQPWQSNLRDTVRHLLRLRRENPALRPERYDMAEEHRSGSSRMEWYNAQGAKMSEHDWHSAENRTMQLLSSSTGSGRRSRDNTRDHGHDQARTNRVLVIVHGVESTTNVTLPKHRGVSSYELLWNSADDAPECEPGLYAPGDGVDVEATSMQLFRAH